jgi:replicative DNA helicase
MSFENENKNYKPSERRGRVSAIPTYSGLGKLPPQATDIEEAILGALMLQKDAILFVMEKLNPDIFYRDNNQKICRAIVHLFEKNKPVDILTVTAELRKSGELEMIGGAYYITELTSRVSNAANIVEHVHIVYEKYIQREAIRISTETINAAYEDTSDVFQTVDKNSSEFATLMSGIHGAAIKDVGDVTTEIIQKLYLPAPEGLLGVASGYIALDALTNGFQSPDLVIVAARPSMGKSAFALCCGRNAAIDFDKKVLVFSLEMSTVQITQRLISADTEIPLEKIRKGNLDDTEIEILDRKGANLGITGRLFIDDTPAISILELSAKAKRHKLQFGLDMIIVDYLQLMKGVSNKQGMREQEIASISAGLKSLAKTLDIPVIALSQLSRAVESRPGGSKRPMLSDLRESGAIEQDADVVMFLYRPEYYGLTEDEDGMPTQGMVEIITAKHRSGICDTVKLRANLSIMKFYDLETNFDAETFNQPVSFTPNPNSNFIIRPSHLRDGNDDDPPF